MFNSDPTSSNIKEPSDLGSFNLPNNFERVGETKFSVAFAGMTPELMTLLSDFPPDKADLQHIKETLPKGVAVVDDEEKNSRLLLLTVPIREKLSIGNLVFNSFIADDHSCFGGRPVIQLERKAGQTSTYTSINLCTTDPGRWFVKRGFETKEIEDIMSGDLGISIIPDSLAVDFANGSMKTSFGVSVPETE
jgi:hypothetical protein